MAEPHGGDIQVTNEGMEMISNDQRMVADAESAPSLLVEGNQDTLHLNHEPLSMARQCKEYFVVPLSNTSSQRLGDDGTAQIDHISGQLVQDDPSGGADFMTQQDYNEGVDPNDEYSPDGQVEAYEDTQGAEVGEFEQSDSGGMGHEAALGVAEAGQAPEFAQTDHNSAMIDESTQLEHAESTGASEATTFTTPLFQEMASVAATEPSPLVMLTSGIKSPAAIDANPAPLGSSKNPIRIVQQGNQYTSMQHLSEEQLAQIMQVVQQQQLLRTSPSAASATPGTPGTSSVIYNPQTQTKIIYRVVYPAEARVAASGSKTSESGATKAPHTKPAAARATPVKRAYKRKREEADADDASTELDPEMDRAQKDARKKHRPRTRSGRVSRPPLHMVKDYKHIHPVDYDEDYDDSDGGYSDFKQSSGEEGEGGEGAAATGGKRRKHTNGGSGGKTVDMLSSGGKLKSNKCDTCGKSYIGRAGLARHFRLNPGHGTLEPETGHNGGDSFYSSDSLQSLSVGSSSLNPAPHPPLISDLPSPPSAPLFPSDLDPATEEATNEEAVPSTDDVVKTMTRERPVGEVAVAMPKRGGGKRGRPATKSQEIKRHERLDALVRGCTDGELIDSALPRIAPCVSVWEYLVLRAARGGTVRPDWTRLLRELADLHSQVKDVVTDKFRPIAEGMLDRDVEGRETIQIDDPDMARCLGLTVGRYFVKSAPPPSPPDDDAPPPSQKRRRIASETVPQPDESVSDKTVNLNSCATEADPAELQPMAGIAEPGVAKNFESVSNAAAIAPQRFSLPPRKRLSQAAVAAAADSAAVSTEKSSNSSDAGNLPGEDNSLVGNTVAQNDSECEGMLQGDFNSDDDGVIAAVHRVTDDFSSNACSHNTTALEQYAEQGNSGNGSEQGDGVASEGQASVYCADLHYGLDADEAQQADIGLNASALTDGCAMAMQHLQNGFFPANGVAFDVNGSTAVESTDGFGVDASSLSAGYVGQDGGGLNGIEVGMGGAAVEGYAGQDGGQNGMEEGMGGAVEGYAGQDGEQNGMEEGMRRAAVEAAAEGEYSTDGGGFIVVRNPDGTIQIHASDGTPVPFETVQAMFPCDESGQPYLDFSNVGVGKEQPR